MKSEKATFAAGCFWHVEETFRKIKGVVKTQVGYTGSDFKDPSYEDVCADSTGHAEAIEIEFDPKLVSYEQLLDVFWQSHNPYTLNRQGVDIGTQYRSAIFYHSEEQKKKAVASKQELQKKFSNKIVTEIKPAAKFYRAEEYHQRYLEKKGLKMCRAF
ncbi:TPA: peptide-methionine (S)-S-oxide reductase MsrA [Candidatus Woesearchaeota archaeon]|nr:peptide-methionine (S)-S-oxide reductase MsrA [Candidatus Woesearchaeota archaeon]